MTVYDSLKLPKIDKFTYPPTYLVGDATKSIEGVRLAKANYDVAVSTIVQRFGRPELFIIEHIRQLLEFKPIRSSTDIERLREFYDKVHLRVGALIALGVPREQYAVVLNCVLLRYLPDHITLMCRQRAKGLSESQ